MNKVLKNVLSYTTKLAMNTAKLSVNTTCSFVYYQPRIPDRVRDLKKK